MIEIKFRAWDKKKELMIEDFYFRSNGRAYHIGSDRDVADEYEVMQFTGLHDKNGKEIYEGDILAVKFNPHYVERVSWKGEPDAICEVFWDFAGFRLRAWSEEDKRYADLWDTDGYVDGILDMNRDHSEVIGNIYENPELLK